MEKWLAGPESLFQVRLYQDKNCAYASNWETRQIVGRLILCALVSVALGLSRGQQATAQPQLTGRQLTGRQLSSEQLSGKQVSKKRTGGKRTSDRQTGKKQTDDRQTGEETQPDTELDIFEPDIIRAELSDLAAFPLLLPASRGTLVDASAQPSLTAPSSPSLFWIRDQVSERTGRNQLIDQWQAYQVIEQAGNVLSYVDVIVNEQLWERLNYFQRYAFVLQFGTAAKSYGYQLRVFHTGDLANRREEENSSRTSRNSAARLVRLRGAHFCSFKSAQFEPDTQLLTVESAQGLPCTVELIEVSGRPARREF